jgi:LysR family transcriptional regulator, pca operon transcriptional activator
MIDGRMKLRHIACFLEVASRAGFGRAAQSLNLTQPAVSRAIRELEDILGAPLFERGRGGAALTAQGEAFRAHAGTAYAELGRGVDTIAQARAGGLAVEVGVLPTVAARVMPRAVLRAKEDGLTATVRIEAGPNEWLLDRLKQGRLDLMVGRLAEPQAMLGLSFEHLYSEEIVAVARPGHPAADGKPARLSDLARLTLLIPTAGSIIRPEVDRLFLSEGLARPGDVIETVAHPFARAYVRASDAVWLISFGVVAEDLGEGALIRLPLSAKVAGGPVGLTMRAGAPLSPAAQMLARAVRKVALTLA